jgi:hypothetical protein
LIPDCSSAAAAAAAVAPQVFFSRRCPLLQWRLGLLHKILYTNGEAAELAVQAETDQHVNMYGMHAVYRTYGVLEQ